jgi:hypothetical protein
MKPERSQTSALSRCALTLYMRALLLSRSESSAERLAISSPRPLLRLCGSSSSVSATRTLRSFTSLSCRTCTESRKQSLRRQRCTPYAGSAYCLTWSVFSRLDSVGRIGRADAHGLGQIACRLIIPQPLAKATKEKISMFCHVASEQVIGVHDVASVYHVPLLLQAQGIVGFLQRRLNLANISRTEKMLQRGTSLELRWKTITTEYVPAYRRVSNSCPTHF